MGRRERSKGQTGEGPGSGDGRIMGRDWKKWAKDRGLNKWFRRDNFIVLVLAGVLLVIIALPTKTDSPKAEDEETDKGVLTLAELEEKSGESAQEANPDVAYEAWLEERLTDILSRTAEVGEVKVMITLKSSRELVVEKEQSVNRSSTNESDSQGGTRTVSQMNSGESTVYRTEGGASEPYVIKTLAPRIEGVVVVAQGAGEGTVDRSIVEIAQALFGVEAHKVKVVRMQEQ